MRGSIELSLNLVFIYGFLCIAWFNSYAGSGDRTSINHSECIDDISYDEDLSFFFAIDTVQCDSLGTIGKINLSVAGNCQTLIKPEYIFRGIIPDSSDIDSFGYKNAHGMIISGTGTGTVIPSSFIGQCVEVVAYVDVCVNNSVPTPFWSTICLEDKEPPIIDCAPVSDTVTCIEAIGRVFTGTITDCSAFDTLLLEEDIEDLCTGDYLQRITRIWQARDIYGNTSDTCSQTILVRRLDFVNDLSIPPNITLSCDSLGGIPTTIPTSVSGNVTISGMPINGSKSLCNTTALFEDQVLRNDTCKYQVMRNWTINEWRCGKDSIIRRAQLITVVDTVAPTISGLPDTLRVGTTNHLCEEAVVLPAVTFTDACNFNRVTVDIFTPNGSFRNQNGVTVSLPVDTNTVYYTVKDPCHNFVRDSIIVIVTDNVGPLTSCYTTQDVVIPENIDTVDIPASVFDIASIDACGGPVTRKVRRMESSVFRDSIGFGCADIGETIMVVLQISDSLGNISVCMIETIVTGDVTNCNSVTTLLTNASTYAVNGMVFNDMGVGIPGVQVKASGLEKVDTDDFGNYAFSSLNAYSNYSIQPEYIGPYNTGVSTLDLISIQRHILGTQSLSSRYREIAADINFDGQVNILDIVQLRKHILGVEELNDNDSWKFVWADATDEKDLIPVYYIPSLETDMSIDFIGIKMGDVTGDAVEVMSADSRSSGVQKLHYDVIDIGGYKEISIKAHRAMDISGLQVLLKYNPDNLIFRSINGAGLSITKDHVNADRIGEIIISWNANQDIRVEEGHVLWRMLFDGKSGNEWNYGLEFDKSLGEYLSTEIYADGEVYGVQLERGAHSPEEFEFMGNEPNPWEESTKIKFNIPQGGMVELELYDAQNRLVYDKTRIFPDGKQKWLVADRDIRGTGIIYGKLTYDGKSSVFKMLKIE